MRLSHWLMPLCQRVFTSTKNPAGRRRKNGLSATPADIEHLETRQLCRPPLCALRPPPSDRTNRRHIVYEHWSDCGKKSRSTHLAIMLSLGSTPQKLQFTPSGTWRMAPRMVRKFRLLITLGTPSTAFSLAMDAEGDFVVAWTDSAPSRFLPRVGPVSCKTSSSWAINPRWMMACLPRPSNQTALPSATRRW